MVEERQAAEVLEHCEEGSPEHTLFCNLQSNLEYFCGRAFTCFEVAGFIKDEYPYDTGEDQDQESDDLLYTEYDVKVRISHEGDTPFIHFRVEVPP